LFPDLITEFGADVASVGVRNTAAKYLLEQRNRVYFCGMGVCFGQQWLGDGCKDHHSPCSWGTVTRQGFRMRYIYIYIYICMIMA